MPYRDEAFSCPACAQPMASPSVALPPGTSVSACERCGGTWADLAASRAIAASAALELEKVDEAASANATGTATTGAGPRACPVCGDPLARVIVAQTELDACARHGTFFDRAELGRVVRILERKRQLEDPTWTSGVEMRWVSGTTSLTRPPPADAEELRERQSAQNEIAMKELFEATGKLLGRLWSAITRAS